MMGKVDLSPASASFHSLKTAIADFWLSRCMDVPVCSEKKIPQLTDTQCYRPKVVRQFSVSEHDHWNKKVVAPVSFPVR